MSLGAQHPKDAMAAGKTAGDGRREVLSCPLPIVSPEGQEN